MNNSLARCYHNNNFKVVNTPNTITLEYYQSIYTHCKQRFNIQNGIEIFKKLVYQYIENHINNYLFGNYNISEVRSNLYNNLVHYSQLETEDLNSETLATYFQELNFNIIKYCEEKYPVQSKYSLDFESKTETSNKDKQKVKQYSRTTPNTPILPKTTVKHLQTSEQGTSAKLPLSITPFPILLAQPQTPNLPLNCFSRLEDFQSPKNPTQQQKPISTSTNIIDYLQENKSNHLENLESKETESEQEETTENKEEMATAYIAKIPEFTGKDNNTSPQKWLDKVQKAGDANGWTAAKMLKAIPYFLQGTAGEWFENLEELFDNWQAFKDAFLQQFTDNNTSITLHNCFHNIKQETSETILDQFIAGLKDKLIKKVYSYTPADLATAIRHAKNYEMAIKEANHTKLTNSQRRLKATLQTNNNKDINSHNNTTKTILNHHPTTNLKIDTENEIVRNYKETNKTGVISITIHHNNLITNLHYQLIIHQDHKIKTQQYQQSLPIQQYQIPSTQQYQVPARRLVQHNQFTPQNQFNFQQTALFKDEATAPKSNSSNNTILSTQIAQNANLLDIFPLEFKANKLLFLLSNATANEQKAITAIPAQTAIVTTDGMKKTLVEEIDNFSFTIDGITIPVKVLVMNAPQYQALIENNWLFKANANLD
ncbi:hypothetical protein G9A89_021096 [Geosiphon pyriformis]|nr:hypothetical protein G9A89_021096 [Geosiphon pyriformis]